MALTLSMGVTAFAGDAIYKDILHAGTNVDVYVNGNYVDCRNASGKPVDVFLFNDTTYVPVRALSEYWGKDVQWEGTTRSVFITDKDPDASSEKVIYLDSLKPFKGSCKAANGVYNIAGKSYNVSHGFVMGDRGDDSSLMFNLDRKYSKIEFTVGAQPENSLAFSVNADDQNLFSTKVKDEDDPQTFTIDLDYCRKLEIESYSIMVTEMSDHILVYDIKLYE